MPQMKVSVPHKLTQDEALRRIKKAIADTKKQNADKVGDLTESWDGYTGNFSGAAMGQTLAGSVSVEPSEVVVEAKIPLMFIAFKGKLEGAARDMLTRLLA
jgi:hypothetical protein